MSRNTLKNFTKDIEREVRFLLEELKPSLNGTYCISGVALEDALIELGKRGFRVNGVDMYSGMLAEAEKAAK